MQHTDVIIIGAGAAGLMCAIEAGKRGRRVVVLDHANKPGKKILMSGGGRCNFTNYYVTPDNFISHNPHFCKSALSRYTPWHFLEMIHKHKIAYHEKKHGQLFCDEKAKDIVEMLLKECQQQHVKIHLQTPITNIECINQSDTKQYKLTTEKTTYLCQSLVIATGGLSIPTLGASPFGYQVAQQFGINVWPTRAGLVPLTLHVEDKNRLAELSGIGLPSLVVANQQTFAENILFTHRGLSGPAVLQISSYWQAGENIAINLAPNKDLIDILKSLQKSHPQQQVKTVLSDHFPKRVVETFLKSDYCIRIMRSLNLSEIQEIAAVFNYWTIKPNGTEGYRTAEVTLGGLDCDALSSKTMECLNIRGLYFIGEVMDVTGWLGGFNFQWAWASGWAAGQVV